VPLTGTHSQEAASQAGGASDLDARIRGREAILVVTERTSQNELTRSYTILAPMMHPGRGPGVLAFSEGTMPEEAFVA
jgi:hypothetical protein